jgi:hypothetical protein
MNEQIHPNLFVFDRARTADGLLFVTGGDRCRYLGKSSREKPDWLKQNEGRYRPIEDVLREDAPRMPSVEAEINLGAGPVEPADSSSSPEVRNDGDDKDDVALADAPLGDCSRPCEPTSLPTPVKENAKKQKPRAGISRSTPKLSPELMRIILDALSEYPVLSYAANKAGIHRKTLEYWLKRSAAGDAGYDVEWQGFEWRFHEHCKSAIDEAHDDLHAVVWQIAWGVIAKTDENGNLILEACGQPNMKMMRFYLELKRPETWAKNRKTDIPQKGGVLVVGDVTKKPKYNTARSVKARKWKADSRRIREEKE